MRNVIFSLFNLCAACLCLAVNPVEVRQTDEGFALYRGGEPYYIKGAGGSGSLEALAAAGGNSVRIWGEAERSFLDKAHALGLSVCVGMWIEHERHGFDYDDPVAVREQIARHCAVIDELKDHPAVLVWAIGNEVELQSTNHKVWDVIEAIAAHAKKVDPHHPTMTVVAHAPKDAIQLIMQQAPSIDILGCNSYGGIVALADAVRETGWPGPYIVTEWGTDGMWESDQTSWDAEIEASSTVKAQQIRDRYKLILDDSSRCLGSYVFHWGAKQETTSTWFNLFLDSGEATESVDALQLLWSGSPPQYPAPRIDSLRINGMRAQASVQVQTGEHLRASFKLRRADPDHLKIHWEIFAESSDKRVGGDREQPPGQVPISILDNKGTCLSFAAPHNPGNYRLFLYVFGGHRKVATANFPFRVNAPAD